MVTRKRLPVDREDVEAAARAGHLEVFRWARDNGCPDLRDWERIAVAGAGWHILTTRRADTCVLCALRRNLLTTASARVLR